MYRIILSPPSLSLSHFPLPSFLPTLSLSHTHTHINTYTQIHTHTHNSWKMTFCTAFLYNIQQKLCFAKKNILFAFKIITTLFLTYVMAFLIYIFSNFSLFSYCHYSLEQMTFFHLQITIAKFFFIGPLCHLLKYSWGQKCSREFQTRQFRRNFNKSWTKTNSKITV